MNIPEKWIAISTTEFYEICTSCDDFESKYCDHFNNTKTQDNRCYIFVDDYPDVQPCDKEQALLYAMTGLEVRPAPGEYQ